MNRLLGRMAWEVKRFWQGCNERDIIAMASCLLGILMMLWVVFPLDQQVSELERRLVKAKREYRHATMARQSAPHVAQPSFPDEALREVYLKTLHQQAMEQGLHVRKITYVKSALQGGAISKLSVVMLMDGTYLDERKFLNRIRLRLPNLAIDAIRMERMEEDPTQSLMQVDGAIYFSAGGAR